MTKNKSKGLLVAFGNLAGAICTGSLLASSFPPLEEYQSAWVALVPLMICARFSGPKQMFLWGLLSGLVFWLSSLSWLLKIAGRGTNLLGAVAAWGSLALYCAIYIGLFAMLISYLFSKFPFPNKEKAGAYQLWQPGYSKKLLLVLLIPLIWVGLEYIRSTLFTGFPWNLLGVSQFRNVILIQIADIGGVYAVSFLVAVMNASIAMVILGFIDVYAMRKPAGGVRVELFLGLLICALCWAYGSRKAPAAEFTQDHYLKMRIASVQPNVPQLQKWSDLAELSIMNLSANTDLASATSPDLIVWPETAIISTFEKDMIARKFVKDVLSRAGAPLLAGAMEAEYDSSYKGNDKPDMPWNTIYYNSSYLVDKDGAIIEKYRKRHLVPFGEYLPFDKRIRALKRIAPLGFSCSAGEEPVVFELPLDEKTARFSSLICFEDVFAYLSREAVKAGARLLVNQTNDAWFDGSSGALQHMSHCVFRCVENRVPAVRSTNTGVTCFILKSGRIITSDREAGEVRVASQQLVLEGEDMPMTFYNRFGDIPFAMPCGILSVIIFVLVVKDGKRKDGPVNKPESGDKDD